MKLSTFTHRFFIKMVFSCLLCIQFGCADEKIVYVEVPVEIEVPTEVSDISPYAFFVGGHVYGNPVDFQYGVHPLFKNHFPMLQNDTLVEFGVFTGDIVPHATEAYWDAIDADLAELGKPVFFAAGNHDMLDRDLFESRYGNTYYSFFRENDLFIVLDPNLDNWNISGSQLSFLQQQILFNAEYVENIFVFFHQMLWWEADNIFQNVAMNSMQGRDSTINFQSEVLPLFENIDNPVVFFAGDMGAIPWNPGFMYYQSDNITFIGSGMGRGEEENFIIVRVAQDKTLSFQLVSLEEGGIDGLGNLEDYVLP